MSTSYTPSAATPPPGTAVATLADGEAINRDAIIEETTPGATPNLTLAMLLDHTTTLQSQKGGKSATNTWTGVNTFSSSTGTIVNLLSVTRSLAAGVGAITDAATDQIDTSKMVWIAATVSQAIAVEIDDTGAADGQLLFVVRHGVGAFAVTFHRPGPAAANIVRLNASTVSGAILIRSGGIWKLLMSGIDTLQGADAS
jgi:hypothetical protein